MKELLSTTKPVAVEGRRTTFLYRTKTWEQKSKAIFFYFHNSLGNLDLELTCSIFSINNMTFQNWIKQKQYFGKWVQYVESFKVSDILPYVPAIFRSKYNDVDHSSKVKVDANFRDVSLGKIYVSTASTSVSHQKTYKESLKSDKIIYILKTTKAAGSGRKVKYQELESFIIEIVIIGWETSNLLSKSVVYNLLISKFGHENEVDRTEWEKKMEIHSRSISPTLSQWLSRVLQRHHFSVRKESISQIIHVNWLQICVEAIALIRHRMLSAGVTRLINADEMFLQFYPKETYLIAPTSANIVGSNRSEDGKKGCTVMVACEMFESQIISPYIVMNGTRDGTLSR